MTGRVDIPGVDFELDTYRLVLLSRSERAATLDSAAVQDLEGAHIRYMVGLQAAGRVLAAGAVVGATATTNGGEPLVGLGFFHLPADEVGRAAGQDPGVRAGLYQAEVVEFVCPKGALSFRKPKEQK